MVRFICLLILITFQGCSESMELYHLLDEACPTGDCDIHLGEIVPGEWDQVLFAKMNTPNSELAPYLDAHNLKLNEFEETIIFAQGRNIIRTEVCTRNWHFEFYHTVFLDFYQEDQKVAQFPRAEARFKMNTFESGGHRNFTLARVRDNLPDTLNAIPK